MKPIEVRQVFPAQAGVILVRVRDFFFRVGIPRASGGDPGTVTVIYKGAEYSPRKRG